jgi:hypothetical protein
MASRRNRNGIKRLLWAAVSGGAALVAFGTVWAAAGSDQVKRDIEARFPVQVLKVDQATADGRSVFIVTVMNRSGDYNEAFQVNRLVVDAATGKLVRQFRHRASGYELSGAARREPPRDGTEAPR